VSLRYQSLHQKQISVRGIESGLQNPHQANHLSWIPLLHESKVEFKWMKYCHVQWLQLMSRMSWEGLGLKTQLHLHRMVWMVHFNMFKVTHRATFCMVKHHSTSAISSNSVNFGQVHGLCQGCSLIFYSVSMHSQ